jgi:hypothetical protein
VAFSALSLAITCVLGCGLFTILERPAAPQPGEACDASGERFDDLICSQGTWHRDTRVTDMSSQTDAGPKDAVEYSTPGDVGSNPDASSDLGDVSDAGTAGALVLHLAFDEGMGSRVFDSSGHGHNGVMTGATWVAGRIGSHALKFENDALITVADAPAFNAGLNGEGITVTAWVKFNGFLEGQMEGGGDPAIVAKGDGLGFMLGLTGDLDDAPRFRVTTTEGVKTAERYRRASIGSWIFYAGVYNSDAVLLYKNGSLWASKAHAGILQMPAGDIIIGKRLSYDSHIDGVIDDVRIYARALSEEELEGIRLEEE